MPIYDRLLSIAEVRRRIDLCWRPYHEVLDAALDEAHRCWGAAWHVNCHSMTGFGNALSPDPGQPRPAFVLGDRDGTSCAPEFTTFVASVLEEMDYTVAINDPYKGAELVLRHGRPTEGRHSLQIEINRDLYMDPYTLEKNDGFPALRASLGRLAERICRGVEIRPFRRSIANPARRSLLNNCSRKAEFRRILCFVAIRSAGEFHVGVTTCHDNRGLCRDLHKISDLFAGRRAKEAHNRTRSPAAASTMATRQILTP